MKGQKMTNIVSNLVAKLWPTAQATEDESQTIETFVKDIQTFLDSLLTPKIIESSDTQKALAIKLKSDLGLQESEIDYLLAVLEKMYKITLGAQRRHTLIKHDMTLECVYRSVRLKQRAL